MRLYLFTCSFLLDIDVCIPNINVLYFPNKKGAIHKICRNILGGRVSPISILQDIRRWGLGKSGLKFRHGGGGMENGPKNSAVFYGRPRTRQYECAFPTELFKKGYALHHSIIKTFDLKVTGLHNSCCFEK